MERVLHEGAHRVDDVVARRATRATGARATRTATRATRAPAARRGLALGERAHDRAARRAGQRIEDAPLLEREQLVEVLVDRTEEARAQQVVRLLARHRRRRAARHGQRGGHLPVVRARHGERVPVDHELGLDGAADVTPDGLERLHVVALRVVRDLRVEQEAVGAQQRRLAGLVGGQHDARPLLGHEQLGRVDPGDVGEREPAEPHAPTFRAVRMNRFSCARTSSSSGLAALSSRSSSSTRRA